METKRIPSLDEFINESSMISGDMLLSDTDELRTALYVIQKKYKTFKYSLSPSGSTRFPNHMTLSYSADANDELENELETIYQKYK